MWHPIRNIPHDLGYIYVEDDHYYVMRDEIKATNWQDLEKEAYQEVEFDLDSSHPYHPLTWDLLEKAKFSPREQEKAQQTFVAGDGSGRVFVRHLEDGKPIDKWEEVETYIYVASLNGEHRYMVDSKNGIATNWEDLEPQAQASVFAQESGYGSLRECPPELAQKALFQKDERIKDPAPWEEMQIKVDHDFER